MTRLTRLARWWTGCTTMVWIRSGCDDCLRELVRTRRTECGRTATKPLDVSLRDHSDGGLAGRFVAARFTSRRGRRVRRGVVCEPPGGEITSRSEA